MPRPQTDELSSPDRMRKLLNEQETKAYMRAYLKAYHQRPEVKAHKRAYMKAYYQKHKRD